MAGFSHWEGERKSTRTSGGEGGGSGHREEEGVALLDLSSAKKILMKRGGKGRKEPRFRAA